MARRYARVASSIWDDPDFRALPGSAQFLYLKLISQRDISMCGVLSLSTHRWAGCTSDGSSKAVEKALSALHEARFVVVDWDTGEALIRTFMRHNDVWASANTAKAGARAFGAVHSLIIREAVTEGVPQVVAAVWPEALTKIPTKVLNDLLREAPPDDPEVAPYEAPSVGAYEGASVGAREAPHRSLPETGDLRPDPPNPRALSEGVVNGSSALPRATVSKPEDDPDFGAFWASYPRRVAKQEAAVAYRKAKKTAAPEEILAGLKRCELAWRAEGRNLDKYPHASTWLNGQRWRDELDDVRPANGISHLRNLPLEGAAS